MNTNITENDIEFDNDGRYGKASTINHKIELFDDCECALAPEEVYHKSGTYQAYGENCHMAHGRNFLRGSLCELWGHYKDTILAKPSERLECVRGLRHIIAEWLQAERVMTHANMANGYYTHIIYNSIDDMVIDAISDDDSDGEDIADQFAKIVPVIHGHTNTNMPNDAESYIRFVIPNSIRVSWLDDAEASYDDVMAYIQNNHDSILSYLTLAQKRQESWIDGGAMWVRVSLLAHESYKKRRGYSPCASLWADIRYGKTEEQSCFYLVNEMVEYANEACVRLEPTPLLVAYLRVAQFIGKALWACLYGAGKGFMPVATTE